jgi:hypothetical protein
MTTHQTRKDTDRAKAETRNRRLARTIKYGGVR